MMSGDRCTVSIDTLLARGVWRYWDDKLAGSILPPVYVSAIYSHPVGDKTLRPRAGDLKYSRENNPTVMELEEVMACVENGDWSLAFSSGMGALSTAIIAYSRPGTRITVSRLVYGSTRGLLEGLSRRMDIRVEVRGPPWEDLLESAEASDIVIVETMGNPTLRIPPLRELYTRCRKHGCRVLVDNTFATPILYKPLDDGAWLSAESTTKYIAGHNDVVGGLLAGKGEDLYNKLWDWRRVLGATMHPFEAYLTIRGMKTLHLRIERSSKTAMQVAAWLEDDKRVSRVYYPGLESHPDHREAKSLFNGVYGGVVSFELVGGEKAAMKFLSSLKIISPAPSLGGVESLASYPYTASHRNLPEEERLDLGITPGLIRLSVGMEDPDDLIEDIDRALEAATPTL